MKKLVISRDEQDNIIESYIDMTQQEIDNLPEPQQPDPDPVSYPTETIITDRATGEVYEGFVENGIWVTQPLGESNG